MKAVEAQRVHEQAWDGKRGHVEAAEAAEAAEVDEGARDRKRCRVGDE